MEARGDCACSILSSGVAKGSDELALLPPGSKGEAAPRSSLGPAAASSESWGTLGLQTARALSVSQGRLGKPPAPPPPHSPPPPEIALVGLSEDEGMYVCVNLNA